MGLQVLFLVYHLEIPKHCSELADVVQVIVRGAIEAHLDALENLVNLRGGLATFEVSNPQLLLLLNLYVTQLCPLQAGDNN